MKLYIDYKRIDALFSRAATQGRQELYEFETYELLRLSGAETPPGTLFLDREKRYEDAELTTLPGEKVVLKIVSATIVHKTEVGGVCVVANSADRIRAAGRRISATAVEQFAVLLERQPELSPPAYCNLAGDTLRSAIATDVRGVLMCQYMPPDSEAFGNELIVGIRHTREFGMVISAGLGGTDTELYASRFQKGQAIVAASTVMTDGATFFDLFRSTIAYEKLAGHTRGQQRKVTDEQLVECFSSFIEMANHYSPLNPESRIVIEELEINPFSFSDFLMVPLDGLCRFSSRQTLPPPRPVAMIHHLLHPVTVGIVGVSARRSNFGRIILNNMIASGMAKENLTIIRPGQETIDGVACVPDLDSISQPLDLLVVAVAAERVPELMAAVIDGQKARTVMLVPGGFGEKEGSAGRAGRIREKIAAARMEGGNGPVVLGGNCIGFLSHPGRLDTIFIPDRKLPEKRGAHTRRSAFISQSGAFMITRLSKIAALDPAYMVSIGNQTDLTAGDFMTYFMNRKDLDVIAVYLEGFQDMDGLAFCRAVRQAVVSGKDVILYKAGRTPEGKVATSGHTASLAGDYMVCESCVRQAGAMVASTFTQFEDLIIMANYCRHKGITGNRLAAVSGAGFEAVGMADNISGDDFSMRLAQFGPATTACLCSLLTAKGLSGLVNVQNPLDINPAADDHAHLEAIRIMAEDAGVDGIVAGLDPLSPAMKTLPEEVLPSPAGEDGASIVYLMPELVRSCSKPIVGVVDGGRLYDHMAQTLAENGVPVFRSSDRAVAALARYMEGRLHAQRLESGRLKEKERP